MITIILGSASDLGSLRPALEVRKHFDIKITVKIASAHRSPDKVHDVVLASENEGTKVFICGAGGAAHLAGAVAARTSKPVIGVPIETHLSGGLDSLLSTVQMPGGVPVATVGVGNFTNAIILATQILAIHDDKLSDQLCDYKNYLEKKVDEQDKQVSEELHV